MGGTTDDAHAGRRGNTRQRIQEVALTLFAERGYDKTSLREIAEALDVTKAALYYHFKSKEDILVAIYTDQTRPFDDLVAWAHGQPPTLDARLEILRRYSQALDAAAPLFRFIHENQGSLRGFSLAESFKERVGTFGRLLVPAGAVLPDQVRGLSALYTLHAGVFVMNRHLQGDPEAKRLAVLSVAEELVTAAHRTENQ
jgi:AcrR family transcriptional regulator